MLCPDGVHDLFGCFVPIPAPTQREMLALCARIAVRTARMLERRMLDSELGVDERALLATLSRSAARRGAEAHAPPGSCESREEHRASKRKARIDGFDLDATTEVSAGNRPELERLCRYLLRPPLADRRLRILSNDLIGLELTTAWSGGTKRVTMDAQTFETDAKPRPRNATFRELMKHGLELEVLDCPHCGARMELVATIFDARSLGRLLRALRLPFETLPIKPARDPPQGDFDFGD